MAADVDPWMPLWINDYLGDTQGLDAEESGAYLHLLMYCWTEGEIPHDISRLIKISKLYDPGKEEILHSLIKEYFESTDTGYINPRSRKEREKAERVLKIRRENGKRGGRPRKTEEKPNGFGADNQTVNRKESERIPERSTERVSEPESKTEPTGKAKRNLQKTPSHIGGSPPKGGPPPMGFSPPKHSEVHEYAVSRGCPQFDIKKWFKFYEDREWRLSKGKPMSNWKTSVDFWIGKNYPGSTKRTGKISKQCEEEREAILKESEGFEAPSLMDAFKDQSGDESGRKDA